MIVGLYDGNNYFNVFTYICTYVLTYILTSDSILFSFALFSRLK